MDTLKQEEKDIILNFYFRCGAEDEINRGRDLIASDPRAAELYSSLEETFQILDEIKYEPCPDNLAELTIARLKQAATSGKSNLENLLKQEQHKTPSRKVTKQRSFWQNLSEVAAIAAMILIVTGIGLPTFSNMRQKSWQQKCASSLGRIGNSIASYSNDHDGNLPYVSTASNSPWWKIGQQGPQNESNTRHFWLLVKNGYINGKDFTCPGRKDAVSVDYTQQQLDSLFDFPSRNHVNYSFLMMCDSTLRRQRSGKMTVIMADLNPVFESFFYPPSRNSKTKQKTFEIHLNEKMLSMTSSNHKGRGQNVLLSAGSAEFNKRRIFLNDDIYTLKDKQMYLGVERPCDENDFFLAP